MNSRHPDPRRVWKGGSDSRPMTPDPWDPLDMGMSSRPPIPLQTSIKKSTLAPPGGSSWRRWSQREPKDGPRASHGCPKTAKRTPKDGQRGPKAPRREAKGTQSRPKGVPRVPKESQNEQREPKVVHIYIYNIYIYIIYISYI